VLVIRRIRTRYHLRAEEAERDVIERVLAFHADRCPVARTLRGCVEIQTELVLEPA